MYSWFSSNEWIKKYIKITKLIQLYPDFKSLFADYFIAKCAYQEKKHKKTEIKKKNKKQINKVRNL